MTSKERIYAILNRTSYDRPAVTPIFMAWAANYIKRTYRDYYLDGDVLVAAQIAVTRAFNLDQISAISDPWREASAYGIQFEYPADGVGKPKDVLIKTDNDISLIKPLNIENAERMKQRVESVRKMAAEIGHEINNYLAIARAQLELFAHTVEDSVNERAQRYVHSLSQQLVRMHRMSRGLMGFWGERQAREYADLNRIVRETVEFVTPLDRFDEVRFSMDLAADLPLLLIDSQQIQQVFLNLFNNAADALRGRSGRIRVSSCHWSEEDLVEVVISDNGSGIPPRILDRVFEPGFTTRADGHGYGLPVCKRIVEQHNARLSVQSESGNGTTFVLSIPVTAPATAEFEMESEQDLPSSEHAPVS